MTTPVLPTPDPTEGGLELVLGRHAGDAIARGADPHAVTDRLGQMFRYLRTSPGDVTGANAALAAGVDPTIVGDRIWHLTQQAPATQTVGDVALHQRYASGALGQSMADANQTDQTTPAVPTTAQRILGSALGVQNVPGVSLAIPGISAALHAITGGRLGAPYGQTVSDIQRLESASPEVPFLPFKPRVSTLASLGANAAAYAAVPGLAELSPAVGGALYGGAMGLTNPTPMSGGARLGTTAADAAVFGLLGEAGKLAGRGIGALANKSGLTEQIGSALRGSSLAPLQNLGEQVGIRGQLNATLAPREQVAQLVGGQEQSAAQQMLDMINTHKAEADRLYGIARAAPSDQLNTPAVQGAVRNADLQPWLTQARAVLKGGANTVTSPEGATVDLPTPEELHLATQQMRKVASGRVEIPGFTRQQASDALTLASDARDALHTASPEWKAADQNYAESKNLEQAYTAAFGQQINTTTQGLNPAKLKTPEAIDQWVERGWSPGIEQARQLGNKAGTMAKIGEQIRQTPITPVPGEGLGQDILDPFSPAAATARAAAFGSPEEAAAFARQVGQLVPPPSAPGTPLIGHGYGEIGSGPGRYLLRFRGGNQVPGALLRTPLGQQAMADAATQWSTPAGRAVIAAQLARAAQGRALTAPFTGPASALPALGPGLAVNRYLSQLLGQSQP